MNVLWRLIFASTVVLITLVATTVNAILDIIWKIMDSIVQVSISLNNYETSICSICLQDVNECDVNNGGCNQTCVNEIGSYHCECDIGFLLHNDSHDCTGQLQICLITY